MIDPIENQNTLDNAYRAPSSNPVITTNTNHAAEANYGIIDWFKKCLRNYTNFSGRARRKEYWYFMLVYFAVIIIAAIIDSIIFDTPVGLFYGVAALGLFLPTISVMVRRLHDTSRSGWWYWLCLVPVIGLLLIVFLASDTKQETNQWGPPAK